MTAVKIIDHFRSKVQMSPSGTVTQCEKWFIGWSEYGTPARKFSGLGYMGRIMNTSASQRAWEIISAGSRDGFSR